MLYFKLKPFTIVEENFDGDEYKCLVQSKTTLSYGRRGLEEKESSDIVESHIQEIKEAFESNPNLTNVSFEVVNERTTKGSTKEQETREHKRTLWRPGRYDYYGDDGYWYDYYTTEIVDVWKEFPIVNRTVTITGVVHKSKKSLINNMHKDNDYYTYYKRAENRNKFANFFCALFPILVLLITGLMMWGQAYGKIFLAQWAEYTEFFNYVFYDFGKTQPLFVELLYFIVGTIWELLKYIFLLLPFILSFISMFGSGKKVSKRIFKNIFFTAISVALLLVQTQVIFTMYL